MQPTSNSDCNMMDAVLNSLFIEEKIFTSEADFQFSFVWKIKELFEDAKVTLEYVPWDLDADMHIDIMIEIGGRMIPVELKYCTRGVDELVNGRRIRLKNQGAQDIRRYTFVKDIVRMESMVSCDKYPVSTAFAIMLTNDPSYWEPSNRKNGTVDSDFRINDGVTLSGNRAWSPNASKGTVKGHEGSLNLIGKYPMHWDKCNMQNNLDFRYVIVAIVDRDH